MNPTRAKRLTRIATGLAHVREDDLLLVAEVVEDLAIQAARQMVERSRSCSWAC